MPNIIREICIQGREKVNENQGTFFQILLWEPWEINVSGFPVEYGNLEILILSVQVQK